MNGYKSLGSVAVSSPPLLAVIFPSGKAEGTRFGDSNKRLRACPMSVASALGITPLDGKMAPALWVAPESAPLVVAPRLFGTTKPHLSRPGGVPLNWRAFRRNRGGDESATDPRCRLLNCGHKQVGFAVT